MFRFYLKTAILILCIFARSETLCLPFEKSTETQVQEIDLKNDSAPQGSPDAKKKVNPKVHEELSDREACGLLIGSGTCLVALLFFLWAWENISGRNYRRIGVQANALRPDCDLYDPVFLVPKKHPGRQDERLIVASIETISFSSKLLVDGPFARYASVVSGSKVDVITIRGCFMDKDTFRTIALIARSRGYKYLIFDLTKTIYPIFALNDLFKLEDSIFNDIGLKIKVDLKRSAQRVDPTVVKRKLIEECIDCPGSKLGNLKIKPKANFYLFDDKTACEDAAIVEVVNEECIVPEPIKPPIPVTVLADS